MNNMNLVLTIAQTLMSSVRFSCTHLIEVSLKVFFLSSHFSTLNIPSIFETKSAFVCEIIKKTKPHQLMLYARV